MKTVLGEVHEATDGIILPHEHICCYSEYAYAMAGDSYLDKERLARTAVAYLRQLRTDYGLSTLIDCTPINIGRDISLLRRISSESEVHIVCSTGFYYTEEPVLCNTASETLCRYIVADAERTNAGIIKCALEGAAPSAFEEKLLRAAAMAHSATGLPIVLHSNAHNKNAIPALSILFSEGVAPRAVTVGHLSDTEDLAYVKNIAALGCYIGLDRLYEDTSEEYIAKKRQSILELSNAGFAAQLLLSHDAQFFNGFAAEPQICERPRLAYCFDHILPTLPKKLQEMLTVQNPKRMLSCR